MNTDGLLSPYRALDLTDDKGFLCGKILADLGAEVIKVERPEGDPSRMKGPYYHDQLDPEKSLFWFSYNQGKKGITLNLESPPGKKLFLELVGKADWVIESFAPGYMESLGLGYEVLRATNPRLIVAAVTPFGQTGPYRDYKATDIVGLAMGGWMYLAGEPEGAPMRPSSFQAYLNAAAEAAVACLIALHYRESTGKGQYIDISMQASIIPLLRNAPQWWDLRGVVLQRQGTLRSGLSSGAIQRQTWPCKDGYISFLLLGAPIGTRTNQALVEWMDEEGMADDYLKGMDWTAFDMASAPQEMHQEMEERLGKFFLSHTALDLLEGAVARRILLYPVSNMRDISQNRQLAARGFWQQVEHPELGTSLTYPGPFAQGSGNPCRPGKRAPLIGEHNEQIYGNILNIPVERLDSLKREGVI